MQFERAIETNRNWLQTYCGAAKFIGAIMIFMGLAAAAANLYHSSEIVKGIYGGNWLRYLSGNLASAAELALLGLLLIALSQFIGRLLDPNCSKGWALKNAHIFLWLWAASIGIGILYRMITFPSYMPEDVHPVEAVQFLIGVILGTNVILPGLAQLLICLGLAHALRKMLPMVDEFESLV